MKRILNPLMASVTISLFATLPQTGANAQLASAPKAAPVPQIPDFQPVGEVPPQGADFQKFVHHIKVKNVPASMMAWWLDPTDNNVPVPFQISKLNADEILPPGATSTGLDAPRPGIARTADVEKISSLDPLNEIVAIGTRKGLAQVQKAVATLDVPLRQVEVEVRYLSISAEDVQSLGLTALPKVSEADTYTVAAMPRGFDNRLEALIADNKAKIIMAPRVTAIDGLTASLYTSETGMAGLSVYRDGQFQVVPDFPTKTAQQLMVSVEHGFTVKPTFDDDDTISLLIAPGRRISLTESPSERVIWRSNIDGVQAINHIEDGRTVALTNVNTRIINGLPTDLIKSPSLLVLVTARVVRRVHQP